MIEVTGLIVFDNKDEMEIYKFDSRSFIYMFLRNKR